MERLEQAFNPATVPALMCRTLISVGWDGRIFDCDFNQMLEIEAGQSGTWEKVLLTFEGVGLTPKDKYWVFVNRKTGLVDRWEFVLKGADTEPTPFDWSGWKSYGAIQLADDRVNPNDGTRIHFPVLDVPASVPDAVFAQP